MATSPVPMFDPSGSVRMIPPDQASAALQAGGEPALQMQDPQGTTRWIPQSQKDAALQAGGKLLDQPAAAPTTTAAPTDQPGLLERGANAIASLPGMQMASGFVKGAEKTAAGGIEALNKYVIAPNDPGATPTTQRASDIAKAASDWLRQNTQTQGWEKVGDIGETVAELMTPEGLAAAGKAPEAMGLSDMLAEGVKNAKSLESNSYLARLARIGLDTVKGTARSAGEMGAQTFVKTGGDPQAAATAAVTGGAIGGVMGAGAGAVREGSEALSDYARGIRPGTRTISDVDVPVLASQNRNAPASAADAADIRTTPDYRAAQQAGAAQITGNEAKNAVQRSLTELNAGRVTPTVTDPARMLAAPEDMQPYQFTMDLAGPEPEATREGQVAFDPRKQHIGTQVVEGKGPGTFNLQNYSPELADAANEQAAQEGTLGATQPQPEPVGSHREPIFQYLNAIHPGQEGKGIIEGLQGGRGTMTFEGPEQAVAGLNQLENVIQSPHFADLEQPQQTRIQNAAQGLRSQLDDFNAYRIQNPHYGQVDIPAAMQHTGDFSQGADQLEQAVAPVYNTLDQVSNGQWGSLRKIEQNMRRITNSPTTPEAYDSALAKLDATRTQMQNIIDSNRTQISEPEWRAANRVYRDASTMRDIHDSLEKSYNGVDPDIAAATAGDPGGGIPRIMTGSDAGFRRLQAVRQSRPEDVQRVLGNGYTNLYRMTDLLRDPDDAVAAKGMAHQIGMVLRRHGRALGGLGFGGVAGAAIGHGLGGAAGAAGGAAAGTLSGVLAEAGVRKAIYHIATDPALADRFIYAVRNRVSPRIAAPLLGSMILHQTQQPQPTPAGGP
jgi:hypothetical protein